MSRLALLGVFFVACSAQPAAVATSTPGSSVCRLAVIQGTHGQGSGPQTPGFLTIPGNTFVAATGAGDGMFYDRALTRWVPAGPPALSADGKQYALVEGDTKTSKVHLVDIASGTDRLVATGGPWEGVGLAADAYYVMRVEYVDSAAYGQLAISQGLWKLPLSGAAPVPLTSDARGWVWVAAGHVYGAGFTVDVAGGPNDVARLDLSTGQATSWFDHHARTRILSVDAGGSALVLTEAADEEVWRVAPSGDAVEVWSGPSDSIRPGYPVAVDGSDVWLSSESLTPAWAIYHFSPRSGFHQVATFTDHPVSVAGPCA